MEHPQTPDMSLADHSIPGASGERVAATIGVHARADEQQWDEQQDDEQRGDERQGEGWWAITDAGARVFVPARAVEGYRTLRNGQRVHLELDAAATPPRVLRAVPPQA